jgi:hypothetical protein
MVEKIFSMSSTKFKLTWRMGQGSKYALLFLASVLYPDSFSGGEDLFYVQHEVQANLENETEE